MNILRSFLTLVKSKTKERNVSTWLSIKLKCLYISIIISCFMEKKYKNCHYLNSQLTKSLQQFNLHK